MFTTTRQKLVSLLGVALLAFAMSASAAAADPLKIADGQTWQYCADTASGVCELELYTEEDAIFHTVYWDIPCPVTMDMEVDTEGAFTITDVTTGACGWDADALPWTGQIHVENGIARADIDFASIAEIWEGPLSLSMGATNEEMVPLTDFDTAGPQVMGSTIYGNNTLDGTWTSEFGLIVEEVH